VEAAEALHNLATNLEEVAEQVEQQQRQGRRDYSIPHNQRRRDKPQTWQAASVGSSQELLVELPVQRVERQAALEARSHGSSSTCSRSGGRNWHRRT